MTYLTHDTARTTGFYANVASFFANIAEIVERRRVYRETFAELSSLSAAHLNDLGISRSDIHNIARRSALSLRFER